MRGLFLVARIEEPPLAAVFRGVRPVSSNELIKSKDRNRCTPFVVLPGEPVLNVRLRALNPVGLKTAMGRMLWQVWADSGRLQMTDIRSQVN